jgi:hypothetical protein
MVWGASGRRRSRAFATGFRAGRGASVRTARLDLAAALLTIAVATLAVVFSHRGLTWRCRRRRSIRSGGRRRRWRIGSPVDTTISVGLPHNYCRRTEYWAG